ncbi:hypothetical protein EPUS_02157 [Endocarpon pusillum Z07020]|uniref:RRM domain-containing protein n=1 Tax=Endocarpon pusillum (strain Z07020 / HMAS-L-300199) TaxID=1263415 RepID=U1HPF3_ENDPU|nr:uncharacterized protein EPUS_02157 [Endocarpon pusillum Z07020]ERF72270.1 hypothetical protein EPUS_02157 [Endocarpon pusillum Z07020]
MRKIPPDGHIRQAHTDNKDGTGWGHITILNKKKAFDAYGTLKQVFLNLKDEDNPDTIRTLRGPEDSLVDSSQRYQPFGHSYNSSASTTLSPPVSPVTGRGNYGCGNSVLYTNLATSPITSMYQPVVPIPVQTLAPLQQPVTPGYNSYPSSTMPVPQRLLPPLSPTHATPQHRYKASTKRTVSKTPSSPSSKQGNPNPDTVDLDGRTVYVYNLPYTVGQQAIKEHLSSVGVVDRCLVKEDRQRSSKYKLTAVVTFRTPQQAQTAIDRFNRTMWKGYEIKIKLDRGPTAAGASGVGKGKSSTASRPREDRRETRDGPLVVNGSGPGISSRQCRVDSDDESSCD